MQSYQIIRISLLLFISVSAFFEKALSGNRRVIDADFVNIVETRYYLMKRLEKPFKLAIKQCAYLHSNIISSNRPIEHAISPDELANLDHNDEVLIREHVSALCLVYKQWLQKVAFKNENNNTMVNNVMSLYGKISELPIPQLLFLLDQMTEQMTDIFNMYEHNDGSSWGHWLKKYWWVPPTIIGSVLIKIALVRFGLA